MANTQHVHEAVGAPTEAPTSKGAHHIADDGRMWLSNGTDTVANWVLIHDPNAETGGGDTDAKGWSQVVNVNQEDVTVGQEFSPNKFYRMDTGSAGNQYILTVEASLDYPDNCEVHIENVGDGYVLVETGSDAVTINASNGEYAITEKYGVATLKLVGTNTWTLFGRLDQQPAGQVIN